MGLLAIEILILLFLNDIFIKLMSIMNVYIIRCKKISWNIIYKQVLLPTTSTLRRYYDTCPAPHILRHLWMSYWLKCLNENIFKIYTLSSIDVSLNVTNSYTVKFFGSDGPKSAIIRTTCFVNKALFVANQWGIVRIRSNLPIPHWFATKSIFWTSLFLTKQTSGSYGGMFCNQNF